MLSKAEIDYLRGDKPTPKEYERVLRHRIQKKLKRFEKQILLALQKNEETQR